MSGRVAQFATAALYQITVALGILLLPVALLARRVGLRLPVHRMVEAAERVHRRHSG